MQLYFNIIIIIKRLLKTTIVLEYANNQSNLSHLFLAHAVADVKKRRRRIYSINKGGKEVQREREGVFTWRRTNFWPRSCTA
jgi:hypothetical protein